MVMIPGWQSGDCEFKYWIFFLFLKENPSLISLILNTKSEKHDYLNTTRPRYFLGKIITRFLQVIDHHYGHRVGQNLFSIQNMTLENKLALEEYVKQFDIYFYSSTFFSILSISSD